MTNTIEFNLWGDEIRGPRKEAEIIDALPEVGDDYKGMIVRKIKWVSLDPEQPRDEVYDYDFYQIIREDVESKEYDQEHGDLESDDYYLFKDYVAIEKDPDSMYDNIFHLLGMKKGL